MESIVKVERHAGGIQIWIHNDSVIDLAERHPDNPLQVLDSDKFIDEVVEQLKEYQQSNDVENGCSHLEWLIDECIQQVYESGSGTVTTEEDNDNDTQIPYSNQGEINPER